MNKLEKLKELMRELEKPSPKNATSEEVGSLCRGYNVSYFKRNSLLDELLPHLIDVAEAANDILKSGDLHYQDCYEVRKAREDLLRLALEPLIEDTDK